MPDGSLGAKKTDVADVCRYIFLLNPGRVEIDTSESELEASELFQN